MAGPYELKPQDRVQTHPQAQSTFTTPAPPNYATFVGGYQPQQQHQEQQQPPQLYHRHEERKTDPELAEEYSIPTDHLTLDFKECFKENKSVQTHPRIMELVEFLYKYILMIVYHFFVLLFGIFIAILCAFFNAFIAFLLVWVFGPILKLYLVGTYAIAPFVVAPIRAMYRPLVDASARVFRQIRVDGKLSGSYAERLAGSRSGETSNA